MQLNASVTLPRFLASRDQPDQPFSTVFLYPLMNDRSHNPAEKFNGPPADRSPITESEMLDWIDGTLDEAGALRLEAASGRLGLRRRIEEMRTNRAVLAATPEATAPAGLAERVMAAVERETLIGLSNGDPVSDSLPISRFPSPNRHRSVWSHGRVQFAMAAGLLLIAGGAAYWGVLLSRNNGPISPVVGDLALNDAAGSANTVPNPSAASRSVEPNVPPVLAVDESQSTFVAIAEGQPPVDAFPSMARAAPGAPTPRNESQGFEEPNAGGVVSDDARALVLAREGRLVMRVIASNVRALPQVTSGAMSESSLRDWKLTDRVPEATIAMVMPRNVPFGLGPGEPILASAEAVSLIGPRALFTWTAAYTSDRVAKVRGTFIAELPATRSVLNAVRSVFTDKLDASVVFEELATPIAASGAVDAHAALWWTNPSNQWVPNVRIPVVVEER